MSVLNGIVDIAAGIYHGLALRSDGTVWSWGYNGNGQLGDGTTVTRSQPAMISGISDVTSVSTKYYFSTAARKDGSVWTWGDNGYGQLARSGNTLVPAQASGIGSVFDLTTGYRHMAALVDATPPSSAITSPAPGVVIGGATASITGTSSDGTGSGVGLVEVSTDNGASWQTATGTYAWTYQWPLTVDGTFTIQTRATDQAGNRETPSAGVSVTVDVTPPVTTPSVPAGTYTSPQSVSLGCSDAVSGCAATYYCLGGGCTPTTPYAAAIDIGATSVVRYYSKDNAGNSEAVEEGRYAIELAPTITSVNAATFTVGSAGGFTATAIGYPTPTFSVTEGTLPSGLTLAADGLLSGTPAAGTGGSYGVTITATNGVGTAATQSFALTVNEAPSITSAVATTFTELVAGTFAMTATGYPVPSLTATGALPAGVTFTDNGNGTATLSGTPEAATATSYPFTLAATNGVGGGASQGFTLTVQRDTTAPTLEISMPSDGITTTNRVVNVTGRASDIVGIASLTINGVDYTASADGFSAAVLLGPGANAITVAATDRAGNPASAEELAAQTESGPDSELGRLIGKLRLKLGARVGGVG